jgi:hypothetical protein
VSVFECVTAEAPYIKQYKMCPLLSLLSKNEGGLIKSPVCLSVSRTNNFRTA